MEKEAVMRNHGEAQNTSVYTSEKTTVDVSKIYNGEFSEINLDFFLDVEENSTGEYEFAEKPHVTARVFEQARGKSGAESYVALEIEISGRYTAVCARCAKELENSLKVSASYGVTRRLTDDCEEYVEAPEGLLDVEEIARTLFYLELPSRVLCKDDCKGLCPVCGTDLNVSACSCKSPERGNRLTGLKKLLDNYEE